VGAFGCGGSLTTSPKRRQKKQEQKHFPCNSDWGRG
jgi:hypothetical protein